MLSSRGLTGCCSPGPLCRLPGGVLIQAGDSLRVLSHTRVLTPERSLAAWMKRSQHHFGVFYQQDSRCTTPWPAPSTSCVRACVCLCASACVQPCLCACEHVETKWQTTNQSSGKTGSLLDSGGPQTACCCLSRRRFAEETLKSCLLCSWILEAKWAGFTSYSVSPVKKKGKKERRGPSGLTAPFILYYPAWLLTPGELCSQIDALLLWGCSRNIKLYWNIHMWVHLAESNWCATPQTLNGNVAEPRHALADTLSYSHWDQAKASDSDPSGRPPVPESAPCPENIWLCSKELKKK